VPVPDAPLWLVGAWNHLGRAVAAIDIGALHGLAPAQVAPPYLLVVESAGNLLGLVADEVRGEFVPPPFSRRGALLEVVDRKRNILFLDVTQLTDALQRALTGQPGG
jgi:chemotaxis signal transduction protein